ncbi:MAG: hypothetical protein K5978_05860 [Campylobacter sp.]|nr:hypothetical protein [Campylobacter sp.]
MLAECEKQCKLSDEIDKNYFLLRLASNFEDGAKRVRDLVLALSLRKEAEELVENSLFCFARLITASRRYAKTWWQSLYANS